MANEDKKRARLFPVQSDPKRAQVIEATIESINKDGIENLTFDSIARAMGKRPSHVKYHFPSKEKAVDAALRYSIAKMQDYIIRAIEKETNPKQALDTYLTSSLGYLEKNPKAWPIITLFLYYCSRDKEIREINKQFRETAAKRISAMLEEMGMSQTQWLAQQIFMLVHIHAMEFIYDQSPGSLSRSKARLTKRVHRLLEIK